VRIGAELSLRSVERPIHLVDGPNCPVLHPLGGASCVSTSSDIGRSEQAELVGLR
jgi:hypothetical protein